MWHQEPFESLILGRNYFLDVSKLDFLVDCNSKISQFYLFKACLKITSGFISILHPNMNEVLPVMMLDGMNSNDFFGVS